MSDLNIHQRLAQVRRECPYIKKDKKVESYMAVTHDRVTAEVRDWMITHGVSISPFLVSERTVETGTKTKSGTPIIRFEAVFDIAFINVDRPADREVVRVAAHANDQGDKAPGKALSYATKSALLKVLMIETGENDESRSIDEVSTDDIVEHEQRMSDAATKDELRASLAEAMAVARNCSDKYALRRFKAHAEKVLSQKFNEFMPSAKTDEPKGGEGGAVAAAGDTGQPAETKSAAPQAPAAQPPKGDVKLATNGMVTTVKKAMERTSKTEDQLVAKFGFGTAAIPADKINEVIQWARS